MAKQGRPRPTHYAPDGEVLCVVGRRKDVTLTTSPDPRETTCGQCEKLPAWKTAWKLEAKRAKVPARR